MPADACRAVAMFTGGEEAGIPRAFSTVSKPFRRMRMLWTIFLVLVVLWMLGVVSSYTLGGFIHVLLVLAIVALLVQLIQGRRVV